MRAADGAGERVEHRLAKSADILPHHARRLHRCAGTFAKGQDQGQRLKRHQCAARLVDFGIDAIFVDRSEEHTSELQSLMRISYAVFCLQKQKTSTTPYTQY